MEEPIQYEIKCPIFLETDAVIKNIISKFWKVNSKERRYYIQDILVEVEALLTCSKYSPENSECLDCHYTLRKYIHKYKLTSSLLHSTYLQKER